MLVVYPLPGKGHRYSIRRGSGLFILCQVFGDTSLGINKNIIPRLLFYPLKRQFGNGCDTTPIMPTHAKWISILILLLSTLTLFSCEDGNQPDNNTTTDPTVTAFTDYAWEAKSIDFNISSSEDYADIEKQSLILYFFDESQGVCRFNLDVSDSEGDNWGTKNELSRFTYIIDGSNITISFPDTHDPSMRLTVADDRLYNENYTFIKRDITSTDRKYIPFTGNCGKGDNKVTYTYWPWGELKFEGEGEMMDFTAGKQPWANREVVEVYADDSKITSIGANFLNGFSRFSYIQLPSTVKKIGAHAFEDCISLERINGHNFEPEQIDEYAFAGCTHLQTADISKCKRLGDYAYYDCKAMSIISEIKQLEEIGNFAFFNCASITTQTLVFPETLKKIGNNAFAGIDLYKVTLPESLVELGEAAFMHEKIQSIYIGKNLTKLDNAFLTEVTNGTLTINQSTPPTAETPLKVMGVTSGMYSGWTLKVPKNASKAYKAATYWSRFKIVEDPSLSEQGTPGTNDDDDDDDQVATNEDERLDIEYSKSPLRGSVSSYFRGSGTSTDPYLIASAADLRLLSDKVRGGEIFKNKYFKQTADIVINHDVLTSDGHLNGNGAHFEQWIPIGRMYPSYFFCGKYDGDGHSISGLYYNRDNGECGGLFGKVFGSGASIINLTVKDSYFKGKSNIGAVAGDISEMKDTQTIPSTISDYYRQACNVRIRNCKSHSTVSGSTHVGGIVGHCNDKSQSNGKITISQCAFYGHVSGLSSLGGILGYGSFYSDNSQMSHLYNEGSVTSTEISGNALAGGICGYGSGMTVISSLNRGQITGRYRIGGIVGSTLARAKIQGALNLGVVDGEKIFGQIIAYIRAGEITNTLYMSSSTAPAWGDKDTSVTTTGTARYSDEDLKSKKALDKLNKVSKAWAAGADGYPTLKWLLE